MKSEFVLALNQISTERTLPREVITQVIEQAIVQSYRKHANVMISQAVSSIVDIDSGDMRVFVEKEVVDGVLDDRTEITLEEALKHKPDAVMGDVIMVDVTPKDLGRIAAQNAKQLIVQKLREAEKDSQFNAFIEREGEIVNGTVQTVMPTGVTVNLGRIEAQLLKKEMIPGEKYDVQSRVRAYVSEVKRSARGPQVFLSRAHKNMLKRLLEIEVPEVSGNAVEIKAIAREPGSRSKVAVAALQSGVDPVGACVGQRGARIQTIINELRGEKIDIIEWDEDALTFATNALSPAKVSRVSVQDAQARVLEVVVEDSQLSLAIGKKGQNVRLASKLLDWDIRIKSEEEKRQEVERQMAGIVADTPRTPLVELAGLGEKTKEKLAAHGVGSVEELAGMTPEQLTAIPGIGEKMVQKIAAAVKQHFEGAPEAGAPEAAPVAAPAAEPDGVPAAGETAEPAPADEATEETEVAAETSDVDSRKGD
jgi:N utilization substance protein A